MLPYLGGRWGGQQPDPSPCPQKRHGDRDVRWDAIWVAPPATPICRSHPIADGQSPKRGAGSRAIGYLASRQCCPRGTTPNLAVLTLLGPSS